MFPSLCPLLFNYIAPNTSGSVNSVDNCSEAGLSVSFSIPGLQESVDGEAM